MPGQDPTARTIEPGVAAPLVVAMALERALPRLERSAWYLPLQTTLWAGFAVAMFVFYRPTSRDFIYFQF